MNWEALVETASTHIGELNEAAGLRERLVYTKIPLGGPKFPAWHRRILANLAMEIGRPIVYDWQQRLVVSDAEATKRLHRPYREPWKHPGVG